MTGYDDEKVRRLTKEALAAGFNHFKVRPAQFFSCTDFVTKALFLQMKVGSDPASDLRRGMIIRSVIDDPANLPPGHEPQDPKTLIGKNAGPTGSVLMIDANQARNRLDV